MRHRPVRVPGLQPGHGDAPRSASSHASLRVRESNHLGLIWVEFHRDGSHDSSASDAHDAPPAAEDGESVDGAEDVVFADGLGGAAATGEGLDVLWGSEYAAMAPACELIVANRKAEWREGECVLFDDSFVHEARLGEG